MLNLNLRRHMGLPKLEAPTTRDLPDHRWVGAPQSSRTHPTKNRSGSDERGGGQSCIAFLLVKVWFAPRLFAVFFSKLL